MQRNFILHGTTQYVKERHEIFEFYVKDLPDFFARKCTKPLPNFHVPSEGGGGSEGTPRVHLCKGIASALVYVKERHTQFLNFWSGNRTLKCT